MATTKVSLSWESRQMVTLSQKAMTAGLREAGKYARRGIKAELGTSGPSAEGSPPGKVSGDLRRAVSYRVKSRARRFSAMDVGVLRPNRYDRKYPGEAYAKALRLARGFTGRDRLGRFYRQRGRPFVDPFLRRNESRMAQIVQDTASTWMPKAKRGST
ncbi:MAG: hypothetical protein U5R31_03035 [Acidimicrobiia bacterium]|nr:hypothetical protein [Acidimicrobiia bacterium]